MLRLRAQLLPLRLQRRLLHPLRRAWVPMVSLGQLQELRRQAHEARAAAFRASLTSKDVVVSAEAIPPLTRNLEMLGFALLQDATTPCALHAYG